MKWGKPVKQCSTCKYVKVLFGEHIDGSNVWYCNKWDVHFLPWYVPRILKKPFWCPGWMRDLNGVI